MAKNKDVSVKIISEGDFGGELNLIENIIPTIAMNKATPNYIYNIVYCIQLQYCVYKLSHN